MIRKNKSTIGQQNYLESAFSKKGFSDNSQHLFHHSIAVQKKRFREKTLPHTCSGHAFWQKKYGSNKKEPTCFRAKHCQKKCGFQKKGTHSFFRAEHCDKISMGFKKVWVPKKGIYTCSGQTFCQKKYGFQQKGNHIFSGQTLRRKKYGFQKKSMSSKKKGTNTFLGQHSAQKSMSGKKKVWCHLCRLEAGAWPSDVPPSTWLRAG
jgi:hypothetical protein